jgi:hypothetical protein
MMNSKTWGRLNTLAREFVTYKANEFGILIPYYREIPIVDSGIDKAGADIITNTETLGTSTDCTSIYAVRFGERSNLTIATNIGLEIADLGLVGNFYTHSVELDADLGLCDDTAIARLEGIRL